MLPINGIKETAIKKSRFTLYTIVFSFSPYLCRYIVFAVFQFVLVISTATLVAAALQINFATYKSNHTSLMVVLTSSQCELA